MNLNNLHKIYLLGIGGIGMSALARYFYAKGVKVSGYDKTQTTLTKQLQSEGIDIHFDDNPENIPENIDLIIYTPAIPENLKEFIYLKKTGIPIKKRSEVLGILSGEKKTIAVAGTHGKTTVSTLIAFLLKNSDTDCTAFLGGIAKNYDTNILISEKSDWIVIEADEYDRSFLQLKPAIGVITSVDADHLDIYESFDNLKNSFVSFANQIQKNGTLIFKKEINLNLDKLHNRKIFSYSLKDTSADFHTQNLRFTDGLYIFDFVTPENSIKNIVLGIPGLINVENAVVAIASAYLAGVTETEIKAALPVFSGIKRRFDFQIKSNELIYIDDYAHHPEEIKGMVSSVKEMYPGKKILGIFQPHLYSRTKDFANEFAQSLELLDEIILIPIYPARETPIKGVSSEMILNRISKTEKQVCTKENLINIIAEKEFDILLTLGAGDIDQLVKPIKNYMIKNR